MVDRFAIVGTHPDSAAKQLNTCLPKMKRWFVIFMLVLLPLEWAYAASCSLCHIPSASNEAKHFHESGLSNQTTQEAADDATSGDTDCQTCHTLSLPLPAWSADNLLGSPAKGPLTGGPILPLASVTPRGGGRVPIR
jgi:hypothetical protein